MLLKLFFRIRKSFYKLNLFEKGQRINNPHQIRNQFISTRIFILLFILIFSIFLLYFFSTRITINETIELKSELMFKQLKKKYNDTLKCPCSNLSIPYQTFLSLKATFHPICSLNLETIINILFNYTETLSNKNDFRFTATLQFHFLTLLCSSVDEIIGVHLNDLKKTSFTNILLLEESNLRYEVEEIINEFSQKITNHFINSLKMIRINTFGSQLVSGIRSNYIVVAHRKKPDTIKYRLNEYGSSWILKPYSQTYDGSCDCSTSFSCTSPAFIYENNQTYILNGFRIGCFILESLLASSLECFYNSSCISLFLRSIQLNATVILLPSKKFSKTDSIEIILNMLMVEKWHHSTDYNAYFLACHVNECSYSFESHRSWLSIATTMLDLIGGLPSILMFIIPIVVAFIQRRRHFQTISNQSIIYRFRRSLRWKKLTKPIRLINLFKSIDSRTELDIRNEFLSTRIYIILLITILSILIQYRSMLIHKITMTIRSPSLDIIDNTNESSIICPCSMVNVPFRTYLKIDPIFHPICSSDFINETWLNTIDTRNNSDARILKLRFRILSLFCQHAQQTLSSELRQLDKNYILSTQLLSKHQLEAQINVSVHQTITIVRSIFANSLQLMIDTTYVNKFLSADVIIQEKSVIFDPTSTSQFSHIFLMHTGCSLDSQLGNIILNQFYTNCDALQALFNSSFISFYDETIIKLLSNSIANISHRPLNLPIIYSINTRILSILNTLMLDKYSINLSYKSYFNQCNPQICTYTKISQEKLIDIIIAAIGFIGGLTGTLQFLIWHLVRLLRRPKNRTIINRRNLFKFLHDKLRSLNIFRRSAHSTRNEIISTRGFIVLFITILMIFTFYTALTLKPHLVTTERITYANFISLDKRHSSTLICSCSNMVIPYQTFIRFAPKFHQICSSVFINNRYLDLFVHNHWWYLIPLDARQMSWSLFSTIELFCILSQKKVEEQVRIFLATKFVSSQVINKQRFYSQINETVQTMIQSIQRQTAIEIKLIRDTTYSNQIISTSFSNVNIKNFQFPNRSITNQTIGLTNIHYGNCNCLTTPSCVQPAFFQEPDTPKFYFPGFFIGCYIFESVLRSSMECLYSQKCINQTIIRAILRASYPVKPFPYCLNQTENSSYTINTTFSQLFDNLMIETWGESISHENYFHSCKPSLCTHSIMTRREFLYIITTLFGIIGGLNTILKLIVPFLVSIGIKFLNRNRIMSLTNKSLSN